MENDCHITLLESYKEIKAEWNVREWRHCQDADITAHPFFTPELAGIWLELDQQNSTYYPCFLLMENKINSAKLLWPLLFVQANWKKAWLRTLIPAGQPYFDYASPIFCGDEALRETMTGKALEFIASLRCDSVDIRGIARCPGAVLEKDVCPYIDLGAYSDGEDFLRKAHKSLREDIRRQLNRIRECGELHYEICDKAAALAELPDFLKAHSVHWKNKDEYVPFYEKMIENGLDSVVRFDRLRLNGKTIAWHLGFHFKDKFYYYMPATNSEYSKFSPGKILLYKMVEHSIAEGDRIFDLLRGNEKYKYMWTSQEQALWCFRKRSTKMKSLLKFVWNDHVLPCLLRIKMTQASKKILKNGDK